MRPSLHPGNRRGAARVLSAAEQLADAMTETDLLAQILGLRGHYGWLMSHSRPGRTTNGWVTPISGDPGVPDLTMTHDRFGLFVAELKAGTKWTWRPGQRDFLARAGRRGFLWHARDLPDIHRFLETGEIRDHWLIEMEVSA